uniref:Integrase, catalytic region, zinc finger, CCHC-type, peptidase aspartic, catalytic n=1 Tax=Tanacetum cinerariifolium TaxID=118510 RepID=A0A6L2N1Q8_TANCI|nr:integrase, catalytic region, zinc finger, CCHC-type, peptidase aspartic, catalytic [Tanacetum cinerariifolium]
MKRYIDTKPNHELIHYCLEHPPYKFKWAKRTIPVTEGSSETTTERYMENYKDVLEYIRNLLNVEAKAVYIILTRIDNDIYSIINACLNAMEMWKAIERLKQGTHMVQQSRIKCYNCKEFRHVTRKCQKPKRAKDAAYHKDKMLLYNYNVFANDKQHPEQPEYVNDTYPNEQGDTNITTSSLDMSTNGELIEIILFIIDSGCSKHMTGNLKLLTNFVENFLGTLKFRNDQIAPILGYGDLVQGTVTIKRVYYVKGLNHNLFSVGQFCDADLEVAFQKSTCYIRDLKGNDLLTGSRGTDLYSITL